MNERHVLVSRSSILTPELRVRPDDVRWFFTADFYDGPISGLAMFRGRVCRFCCFSEDIPEQHVYVLHDLSGDELGKELRLKEKIENLVGTHFSFDEMGEPLPHVLRPQDLASRFYVEEPPRPSPEPSDSGIIAWFDVDPEHPASA